MAKAKEYSSITKGYAKDILYVVKYYLPHIKLASYSSQFVGNLRNHFMKVTFEENQEGVAALLGRGGQDNLIDSFVRFMAKKELFWFIRKDLSIKSVPSWKIRSSLTNLYESK